MKLNCTCPICKAPITVPSTIGKIHDRTCPQCKTEWVVKVEAEKKLSVLGVQDGASVSTVSFKKL